MSTRVLIAGCGDVGSRVARRLLAGGDEVHALRRTAMADDGSGLHWWQADLAGPGLAALPAVDSVVFAATPDTRDETAYRRVFLEGLQRLLAALDRRRLRRVILVSSTAVYGDHGGDWVGEDTPAEPLGFNGQVLLEAEQWLAAQPLSTVSVRLAGLYGPGRLQLAERLREGKARAPRHEPVYANRIHVDDAAAALVHVLRLPDPARCYLGVDDTPLPLHEFYDAVAAAIGAAPPADGPPPPGIGSKRLSNQRLRATGWVPAWPDARAGYAALLAPSAL
jgi:nucleoside-diphosphate-sugar epimerase